METKTIFKIFADNPPSIAIAGAIILFILGSAAQTIGEFDVGKSLYVLGGLCLLVGCFLQLQWLKTWRHRR